MENDATNIYLLGFRGSGKSSVGKQVASRLGFQHWDTDDLIVSRAGQTIQQIFSTHGQAEFRRLETEVIRTLQANQSLVISLGGGAILAAENRDRLRATGQIVWLKGSAETLFARIQQDSKTPNQRPALTCLNGLAEVQKLLHEREPIYAACADFTVDVEKLSIAEVSEAIVQWWKVDRVNNPFETRDGS
jgi:shikimate kinase